MSAKDKQKNPALLLDPIAAAGLLSISPRKLWEMTAKREIPRVRLGRCVRYSVKDLERWIDEHKEGGSHEHGQ